MQEGLTEGREGSTHLSTLCSTGHPADLCKPTAPFPPEALIRRGTIKAETQCAYFNLQNYHSIERMQADL